MFLLVILFILFKLHSLVKKCCLFTIYVYCVGVVLVSVPFINYSDSKPIVNPRIALLFYAHVLRLGVKKPPRV